MRLCLPLAVWALSLTCTAAQASPPAGLDVVLRADVAKGFSGAVLVARGNALVLDRAYGAIGGVALRPASRFWIASAGKQFVSAAILKCAEHGWLGLDDTMARFLPEVPPDKRAITVRQLLGHLSGLDQTYASEGAKTRDDAVRRMLSRPLIDVPGHRFHYSNDNYELAAAIVERASGENYRAFVQNELWRPAGLHDTGFNSMPGARAVVPAKGALPARLRQMTGGEAGVYSTTRDLLKWYRALVGGRVLSRRSVETLFSPLVPIAEGQAGLGWFLGRTEAGTATIFTRGNEDFGANALVYAYPGKDIVIVVLTHAGDADDDTSWSRTVLAQLEKRLRI